MVLVVAISVLVLAIQLPPATVLGKASVVGYAICHQIPERSFFIAGRQLPLCARCTGTFLGAILGLGAMLLYGRRRAAGLPPVPVLGILVVFVGFWGLDGLNSYLTFFPGAPHLYEPQNWLRLTTGMLNGIVLGSVVFSIFNFSVWRAPRSEPVIRGLSELGGLVALGALLIGLVLTEDARLLYPLALASTLGVVVMLTGVNSVIVLVAARRENCAYRWRDAAWPLLVGLALSLLIVMGMGAARTAFTQALDLPF